jgi:TM2 domain-containing membrane protein YozV
MTLRLYLFIVCLFTGLCAHARVVPAPLVIADFETVTIEDGQWEGDLNSRPHPLKFLFKKRQEKNKKAVCAIMAFPFPFGIVGLHRIYMGTAPHVPIVYIASLGGAFGILPMIDFFIILIDKDLEKYIRNKKVFMWVN